MRRSSKIAIVSGIAAAVIITVMALTVHFRLSEIEGNEKNGQESASQIANEIIESLGNKTHSETGESGSEGNESGEQHEKEAP